MQESLAPDIAVHEALAAGIDGVEPELFGIGHIGRKEAPEHHMKSSGAGRLVADDDGLCRLRCGIVIRRKIEGEAVDIP